MSKKTKNKKVDPAIPHWFIDLDWYQRNNRSFSVLARSYLCPDCRERLKGQKVSATDLLSTIADCCSQTPDFITDRLPIMESVFRLFVATGNQPLELEELVKQLGERRVGNIYSISGEVLSRLLDSDRYYGLCLISG